MDLMDFLRARLGEEATAAQGNGQASAGWHHDDAASEVRDDENAGTVAFVPNPATASHITLHDPAHVLREIKAKLRMIRRGDTLFCECPFRYPSTDPDTRQPIEHHYDCTAYRIAEELAVAYREHPDYNEDWLPFEYEREENT